MRFKFIERAKQWARTIKRDVHAVYLAARDMRTPVIAKALALFVAAYAISPIDLIPDFIPVIGYLDDLIFIPLGIALVIRLIPSQLMTEFRVTASNATERPISRIAAAFIIIIWLVCFVLIAKHFYEER